MENSTNEKTTTPDIKIDSPQVSQEKQKEKDENGPITPEDLQTPEVEIKDQKPEQPENSNNEEKKEEKKEEYNDINNEIDEIIKKVTELDEDKTLYKLCENFKNKYKEKLPKDAIPTDKEKIFITKLNDAYNKYSTDEKYKKTFLEFLFNIYELLPYLYHPLEFSQNINFTEFENPLNPENFNKFDYIKLFSEVKPSSSKNNDDNIPTMNNLIDTFILYIYNNYTDNKSLYIENNLFSLCKSRSVFISFKIISLCLHLYTQLTKTEINVNLFVESISNVARILLQEASYYNQKFNNEYFENAFADFDFNNNDQVKRKLSMEEFKYLTKYLFKFLSIIVLTYSRHLTKFDYESKNTRELFWKIYDDELNGFTYSLKTKTEIDLYTYYILFSFVLDIVSFIFTNFFYIDKRDNDAKEFHFDTYDPFYSFEKTKKWMNPDYHKEFLEFIINNIYYNYHSNIVILIEQFLSMINLKDEYKEKYDKILESNSRGGTYFFIYPVNSIGISCLLFMLDKINKYTKNYFLYSPLYILDIHLPLIAAQFKGGNTLKYLAIDTLVSLVKLFHCNAVVPEMKSLTFYSFDDIFNDVLSFIASQEPDNFKRYVNSQLIYFIGLLQNKAKYEFFNYYIERAFKPIEGEHIDDEKTSYFIQIIKSNIKHTLKNGKIDYEFWNEKFVKKIIETFAFSYEKIFIFEIIETISTALNFIFYMILLDKKNDAVLKIYNKEYLYVVRKNLNGIISLVEKFIKSKDEEKYKTLGLHVLTNDEDSKNIFRAKNAQCEILLGLTNQLDNLISKSLNELSQEKV